MGRFSFKCWDESQIAADKFTNRHAECVDCHDPHSSSRVVKAAPKLCFDCHCSSNYTGTTQNGSTSSFSNPKKANLHLSRNHSSQPCTACHTTVPHGTSHEGLLVLIGEANSKSLIDSFKLDNSGIPMGTSKKWAESSCNTSCH